jgi:hypothetical protein
MVEHFLGDILGNIARLRPVMAGDADFDSAVAALKRAVDDPVLCGHRQAFWLVDHEAESLAAAVLVVDVTTFGLTVLKHASGDDWKTVSQRFEVFPLHGDYNLQDVFNAAYAEAREFRVASESAVFTHG